jgi:hypothetical protein
MDRWPGSAIGQRRQLGHTVLAAFRQADPRSNYNGWPVSPDGALLGAKEKFAPVPGATIGTGASLSGAEPHDMVSSYSLGRLLAL